MESIFAYDGGNGHVIVFVCDGRLVERSIIEAATFWGVEGNGVEFTAYWIDPTDPVHGWPVYPDGLVVLFAEVASGSWPEGDMTAGVAYGENPCGD